MARLQLTALTKTYGDVRAVAGVDLDIRQGELVVLLGPSGCGKTTTLRMIAGFVAPTAGEIRLGGHDITRQPPWKRNTGLVFQSYALFPHLTAAENIAFGLRMRNLPQPRSRRQARGSAASGPPRGARRSAAARIVGRPAAARRARARARDRAGHPAARRAAVESRREAARRGPRRDSRAAAQARAHDGDGHARPGRGADDGRPARRDVQRQSAAGRLAARALRASRQCVCRGLRRPHEFRPRPGRSAGPLPQRKRSGDPVQRRCCRQWPDAGAAPRAPLACDRSGRGRRQLLSGRRRVRVVPRRDPGILCALDASRQVDGASARTSLPIPRTRSAIGSICTGRPRPASCLPTMAAARADRQTPSRSGRRLSVWNSTARTSRGAG